MAFADSVRKSILEAKRFASVFTSKNKEVDELADLFTTLTRM
jgi:hypothetical protein